MARYSTELNRLNLIIQSLEQKIKWLEDEKKDLIAKDKQTEKKIKEIVNELTKDINGCYKAITQSKSVEDIRLIFEYKEIVDEITLDKIRNKFPKYFKE